MKQKTYNQVTCLLFLLVGSFHILRLFLGWSVNVGGWVVPMWLSIVGEVAAGFLAWTAYKLEK